VCKAGRSFPKGGAGRGRNAPAGRDVSVIWGGSAGSALEKLEAARFARVPGSQEGSPATRAFEGSSRGWLRSGGFRASARRAGSRACSSLAFQADGRSAVCGVNKGELRSSTRGLRDRSTLAPAAGSVFSRPGSRKTQGARPWPPPGPSDFDDQVADRSSAGMFQAQRMQALGRRSKN